MEVVEDSMNRKFLQEKKRGGWRAITFILGNETLEKLGSIGVSANFMLYLRNVFHMEPVEASNVYYLWMGLTNFAPLLGALISDAYIGRFKTIAYASFFALLGLMTMTLTASLPHLHPPPCNNPHPDECDDPNKLQLGILFLGLAFLSIGSGGIRPCSIPFGVDQFDQRTEQGLKGMASFFNWYYLTLTMVLIFSHTVVVYLQTVSWVIGFSIPTGLMACAVVMFFVGTRFYVYVKPEGSVFSGIARVIVAARKKRNLEIPAVDDGTVEYYDPPVKPGVLSKLPLTSQFKFLDKGAVIAEGDLTSEGVPAHKWRLCSVQEVEEVKCLIRVVPIWSAGIISIVAMSTQATFIVFQAMKMDRHMGPHFEIPAASVVVISYITIGIWLPIYDRLLVPSLWRIRKFRFTLLQRMGIGIIFAILSMFTAGFVEGVRRTRDTTVTQTSVFWLAVPLILMGFCESFNFIGQIEFFNSQFPEHMRSIANSLFPLSFAAANYLSSLLVTTVHKFSGTKDQPDWLNKDLDKGKLDYYYYTIAGLGVVNLVYFWYCARNYQYKAGPQSEDIKEEKPFLDI
ncbi:PREDICTED: protein NRT1/ PTR FAMILY 2.12-like [Camelina sativa]|uniref:Protein NRT1/ PTR FAMILY 2.12-like n=1 Tax=Camelina sativa TaxID=90675 RepID=A0ABM0VRV9_CAMSA|nr:PREDICTED: protein NRT1/ PTR FAMILY 2.12-like [Camelina sativa]